MLSRRLLRVKVLQTVYACFVNPVLKDQSVKFLMLNLQKTYELYLYFLLLPGDLKHFAQQKIEQDKNKHLPAFEDLHPNLRFVENNVIRVLEQNNSLTQFENTHSTFWKKDKIFLSALFKKITESELYDQYMQIEECNFEMDKKLWLDFYNKLLINYKELYSFLEGESIFWNDEIEFIIGKCMDTIKKIKKDGKLKLLPVLKDKTDRTFVEGLLTKTLSNFNANKDLIKAHIKNWEYDRLALMDTLIISIALTEITEFKDIPVSSSFNEYIEITKYYSTSKSSKFVNGVLDKIVKKLEKKEKIKK